MEWLNEFEVEYIIYLWNYLGMRPNIYENRDDEPDPAFFIIDEDHIAHYFDNWDEDNSPIPAQEVEFLKKYVEKFYIRKDEYVEKRIQEGDVIVV